MIVESMKTIAFFGHRRVLEFNKVKEKLLKILKDVIKRKGVTFLIGCHGDFDNLALSVCLDYKKNIDNDAKINVILTSVSYLNKDDNGVSRADLYLNKGGETIFYNIEEIYYKKRIEYSNKKMVDNSDLIICYVDTKSYKSGAKKAVNYAVKQNKKIINLFGQEK